MEHLKELRKRFGLTQEQLAKIVPTNRSYIAKIEAGIVRFSPSFERRLLDALVGYDLSRSRLTTRYSVVEPSKETLEVVNRLRDLEDEDIAKLVEQRVLVQSLHDSQDWQVVTGLVALYIFDAFPRTVSLKLVSEDYRELGALAKTFQLTGIFKPKRKGC